MLHYGEKLKSLREKRGLTTKDLAALVHAATGQNVKPAVLTRAESTGEFSISLVPGLAKALKVPVQKFMRMSGRKKVVVTAAPPPVAKKKSAANENVSAAPKKRGRPKKVVAAVTPAPVTASAPKKRGRPKKAVAVVQPAAMPDAGPKKRRGRPPGKKAAVLQAPEPVLYEHVDDGLPEPETVQHAPDYN